MRETYASLPAQHQSRSAEVKQPTADRLFVQALYRLQLLETIPECDRDAPASQKATGVSGSWLQSGTGRAEGGVRSESAQQTWMIFPHFSLRRERGRA